jgi:hypothetical protein
MPELLAQADRYLQSFWAEQTWLDQIAATVSKTLVSQQQPCNASLLKFAG